MQWWLFPVVWCVATALYAGDQESIQSYVTISGSYIVILHNSVGITALDDVKGDIASLGGAVNYEYTIGDFRGFAVDMGSENAVVLATNPAIALVQPDVLGHIQEQGAPWGLGRVSHRNISGIGDYVDYVHDANGGKETTVFVVDTGIFVNHTEFVTERWFGLIPPRRRATWGTNFVTDEPDTDINGHGTHCAGTIAGNQFGIAKQADVVAVKVCNQWGSCRLSDVIAGIEWAVTQHASKLEDDPDNYRGSVVSMSLGFEARTSIALTLATNAAVYQGVSVVVAAANANTDACLWSPACATEAITVGAVDYQDSRASFSNYGQCVDIWAPGLNVLSASLSSKHGETIMSGTSMATPHVAGLVAYYLSLAEKPFSSPRSVKELLVREGTRNVLADVKVGSPNVLAFNGAL